MMRPWEELMSSRGKRLRAFALGSLMVLAGCGSFQPFGAPAGPAPALPEGDAFPNVAAEDAVDRLKLLGFGCEWSPDSDIPGGWWCMRGNQNARWMQVSIDSEQTGPIEGAFAHLGFESAESKDTLDQEAAATFHEVMLSVFVPDDVRPAAHELVAMVSANWPTELGSGWILNFHRASDNRRMSVLYSESDADHE